MFGRQKSPAPEETTSEGPAPRTTPTTVRSGPAPVQHKTLGELLIEEGVIDQAQLDVALATQKRDGGFLGQVMVQMGIVSQEKVASCLVKQCKIPHLSLLDYDIGAEVLGLIPEETCRQYHLLPIDKLGSILTVAMVDPLDLDALEAIRATCPELRIKPILCNWQHFELVASKVFGSQKSGGQHEVTAKSLGLMERSAPVENIEANKQKKEAAVAAAAADTAAQQSAAQASQALGISNQELANVLRDTLRETMGEVMTHAAGQRGGGEGLSQGDLTAALRESLHEVVASFSQELKGRESGGVNQEALTEALKESMREAVGQLAAQRPAEGGAVAAAPAVDAQQLGHVIQEGVSAAMQEALATLVVQMRANGGEKQQSPDLNQFAEVIRDSVGGAMQEAMAALVVQMRATPAPEKSAGPDIQQMAEVIRDSVGGAMQEAMATLVVQMRAMQGKKEDGGGLSPESLAEVMKQSIQEAIQSAQANQSDQGARLAEIAEAAMQSVQQASLLVESASGAMKGKQEERRSLEERITPIAPFVPSKPKKDGELVNPEKVAADDARVRASLDTDTPQESFSFDSFLPGSANAFTYKLGRAVSENPGGEINPFFLFGHVGVGKTHLISAIGNGISQEHPELRVGYVSASHFARKLAEAAKENATDAFRENYCHWDVLILDDIQFLSGKVEAQEEFFHIFNVLHQAGRQIIIASDKSPDRLGLLEKRLVSRFGSGIVSELKVPEWETRMAILRRAADASGVKVPDEILSLVAMRVADDVRRMTGSLRKIVAYARLVGQDLSCEMADEILSHLKVEAAA